MTALNWHRAAACAGADDPELWFPVGEGARAQQQTEEARAICRACPVIEQCLRWALEARQDVGIWGGLDERQRRRIHRRPSRTGASPKPPRTPASILAERAVTVPGGHMTWPGTSPISYHGDDFTPAQLAWFVAYGVRPSAHLRARCGYPGCITAEHRKETGRVTTERTA